MGRVVRWAAAGGALAGAGAAAYRLTVAGALTLDTGVGRTVRPLGPSTVEIEADRETVFDVVAGPYLGRTPRAMADKLQVWERGSDMVLAAHRTPVGRGLVAVTVETVRFTRPGRIDFRLLRGPVPHVVEAFELEPKGGGGTLLRYTGEIGADGWALGRWWADRVAGPWERAVAASLGGVKAEAERRAGLSGGAGPS